MLTAELPSRDAMVISASATTGNTGDAFQALSKEIAQATSLRRSVKAVFRMPMIMSLLMYAFFYGALVFVAPATMKFLKNLNMSLNLSFFNREYFAFAEVFNNNRTIGTLLYASVPVLVFFFLRSSAFAQMRDRIRRLKTISEKADHAILWNSYALLYDAATSAREACQILSRAAKRDDSRQAFLKLGRLMESGRSLEDSVAPAGFPPFVVTGVKSATTGGNLVEGIADMVKNLDEDVLALTESLKENVKIFAVLVMGLGLAGIFMVTYYPLVSTVLSAL
jgi:type II secretory pathway component PulF